MYRCPACKTTDPDNHTKAPDGGWCGFDPQIPALPCHYCGSEKGPRCFAYDAEGEHRACNDCYAKRHDHRYKPAMCPSCGTVNRGGAQPCELCG